MIQNMMKAKNIAIYVSAAMVALTFVGCKPTEANYRKAYDAALAKRAEAAEQQMRPATGLLSDEGPQMRVLKGDTVFVENIRLSLPDGGPMPGKWAVAVGRFRMDTNARAGAEALQSEGWKDALYARASGQAFYTIAACVPTLAAAHECGRKFIEEHPGYPYVGLPGKPVLLSY